MDWQTEQQHRARIQQAIGLNRPLQVGDLLSYCARVESDPYCVYARSQLAQETDPRVFVAHRLHGPSASGLALTEAEARAYCGRADLSPFDPLQSYCHQLAMTPVSTDPARALAPIPGALAPVPAPSPAPVPAPGPSPAPAPAPVLGAPGSTPTERDRSNDLLYGLGAAALALGAVAALVMWSAQRGSDDADDDWPRANPSRRGRSRSSAPGGCGCSARGRRAARANPTILKKGPYRFYFFANEGQGAAREPPHVHVDTPRGEVKFWLDGATLADNRGGVPARDVNKIQREVAAHADEFTAQWHRFFGQ
jgi:hypothetical protein